ncbi:MAG: hypothetical protein WBG92_03425 [Thiohalocapsa sp.]
MIRRIHGSTTAVQVAMEMEQDLYDRIAMDWDGNGALAAILLMLDGSRWDGESPSVGLPHLYPTPRTLGSQSLAINVSNSAGR